MIIGFNFREPVTDVTYTLVNESGLVGDPVELDTPLLASYYTDDADIDDTIIAIVWNYIRTEDATAYQEIIQRDFFNMNLVQPVSGEGVAPLLPNTLWQHKLQPYCS